MFEGSLANVHELRQKLEKIGIYAPSTSIEEIILELYRFCGDSFTEILRGKFAIIIFDNKLQQLIAARDRYGVRPLYYRLVVGGIGITSELANFKLSTGWSLAELMEINKDSLRHYFSCGYIPENDTYLKNTYHLPAGCLLKFDAYGLEITPFADMLVIEGSNEQLVDEQLFHDVITEGIHARIPTNKVVGIFYTGKVCELVIAAMAKQASSEIKIFSVEFAGTKPVINKSLEAFVIRPHIDADDYWNGAIAAHHALDVPLADPLAPIDYLLAEIASKHVDIIVCADGADVLFGVDEVGIERFKKRSCGLIFTEEEKEELLKFAGSPWSEIIDPYLAQISDLDPMAKWQTLELNTRFRGSTILKRERLMSHHGIEVRFPFLDDKILDIASFLTSDEKKSMSLFKQVFADQISKFQKPKKKAVCKVPLTRWIRFDLYEKIKSTFEQDVAEEFFNTEVILAMLEQHRKGLRDLSRPIWAIAMFIVWLKELRY